MVYQLTKTTVKLQNCDFMPALISQAAVHVWSVHLFTQYDVEQMGDLITYSSFFGSIVSYRPVIKGNLEVIYMYE